MSLCKSPIASWLPEHVVMLTHLRNFVTFFFPSAQLCYLIRSGEYLHWLFINGNFCLRDPYFQSIICHLSRKQLIGFHIVSPIVLGLQKKHPGSMTSVDSFVIMHIDLWFDQIDLTVLWYHLTGILIAVTIWSSLDRKIINS